MAVSLWDERILRSSLEAVPCCLSHAGQLYKLDFSGYGLVCPFPAQDFAAFPALQSLDLSDNFDVTVGFRFC